MRVTCNSDRSSAISGSRCFCKQKTAYEITYGDWEFRRVLFRSELLAVGAGKGDQHTVGVRNRSRRRQRHGPEANEAISSAGGDLRPLRMEADAGNATFMRQGLAGRLAVAGIPQIEVPILAAGRDDRVGGVEGDGADRP